MARAKRHYIPGQMWHITGVTKSVHFVSVGLVKPLVDA